MPDSVSDPEVTDSPEQIRTGASRRTLLRGAMIAGVAMPVLAACGGDDEPEASGNTTSSAPSSSDTPPSESDSSADAGGGGGADAIASTSDVPEGGGIILDDPGIVITQPAAGEFKGFTNICTHQSCPLDNVSEGTINCVCHGSQFSIEDGSPVTGPSGSSPDTISALEEMPVSVQGSNISLA